MADDIRNGKYYDATTGLWKDPVVVVGDKFAIKSAPVNGAKTVTTTAAEVFAGAARLSARYLMLIYNDGTTPIYRGGSGVTAATGFPIQPGDVAVLKFDPAVATPIYLIGTVSTSIRVEEWA